MSSILINGHEADQISVLDRGLQYGDGLFETIRISEGVPHYLSEHLERLFAGCHSLNIPITDQSLFRSEAISLAKNINEAVLKIIVTRGVGGRGYAIKESVSPTRIMAISGASQYPDEYQSKGVTVKICETRLGSNTKLAGIKHLNRLEQILARAEWDDQQIQEGLMRDNMGNVIEGTMSNLFYISDNKVYTPDISDCGVKGIMRDQIIKIAKQNDLVVNETKVSLEALYEAKEVFLCNSLIGIWPVRQLERCAYDVGQITRLFIKKLNYIKHGIENVA